MYLPQMFLDSKFEDSIPFGYLETELSAKGKYFFSIFNEPRNIGHGPECITAFIRCIYGASLKILSLLAT